MNDRPQTPPFAQQRLVFLALLGGMGLYTAIVAFLLHQQGGRGFAPEPLPGLDDAVTYAAPVVAVVALLLRRRMHAAAGQLPSGPERAAARFRATLVPLALLEGGCLFGITTWMLDGRAEPGLVVALVLLALAVLVVPFADPDAAN